MKYGKTMMMKDGEMMDTNGKMKKMKMGKMDKMEHKSFTKLPQPMQGVKVVTFAGGYFWSLSEGLSELKGVDKVVSGYAGGTTKNPTYEQVSDQSTGPAESVQVYYNPAVISYNTLAEAFFYAQDPTTLNRQGPDEGTDYRSIACYRSPEEKKILEQTITKVNIEHHFKNPIVTEVLPYKCFILPRTITRAIIGCTRRVLTYSMFLSLK